MSTRIRPTCDGDAALLPAIERSSAQLFRTLPALAFLANSPVNSVATHRAHIAAGLSWVALDEEGSAPCGFLVAAAVPDALHIDELSVTEARQGRGHGRALVHTAITEARTRGLPAVTLTTFRDVPWNGPFYARMEFAEVTNLAPNRRLADLLQAEAARGLAGRCAMRLNLDRIKQGNAANLVRSRLGVTFTRRSLGALQIAALDAKKGPLSVVCYSVGRDLNGVLSLGLGLDRGAPSNAQADAIGDVVFYWYMETIEELKVYAVDTWPDAPTRLIGLDS